MRYKYTVVREVSQQGYKCEKKIKEGPNHNNMIWDFELQMEQQNVTWTAKMIHTEM